MKIFITLFLMMVLTVFMNPQSGKKAYINGKVYTVNAVLPVTEAVITQGDKIIFTGSNEDASTIIDKSTEVIDLKGKLMLPGFIDAHMHFFNGGFYLVGIDLRPARSEEEFCSILKKYIDKHKGKWITGGYWDHELWKSKQMPRKELIDSFSGDTPVFVDRIDGHVGLANSLVLRMAGITKETKDPEGGRIEKDPVTGEPTGILKDNAMDLVNKILPAASQEEYIEAGRTALLHLREYGITGIHDITGIDEINFLKDLEQKGELTCRIYSRLPLKEHKEILSRDLMKSNTPLLRTGSLKAYADGSLGASTAWFFDPYEGDTSNRGLPSDIVTSGEVDEWSFAADREKFQVCIHAIGDKANNYVLGLYRRIRNNNPAWDRRFRIEHAQHVRFEDIPLFYKDSIIASVQPYHCIDDGVWAENRIGKERIKYTHPYKTFLENDVRVCFGTDWPIAPVNPLLGIYAAVTRRTVDGKNPEGWIPEQKISVEDAVKCYTINSAYAGFSEQLTGSIEPGKYADLIILSDDIFKIDPVKIKDVKVDVTIFNGEIVYSSKLQ